MLYVEVRNERIPALGLGTWRLWGEACFQAVTDALEIGYRHVDTAQMYANEDQVGRGVRASGIPRDEIFLTTKIDESNLAAPDVRRSVEGSLHKLGMDYVDLLLIHWPDLAVPLEETLDAMLALQEEGKTRHIGVSNFTPDLFRRATAHAPIACNQVEYHPFLAQDELLELARANDALLAAYSPIARGRVAEDRTLRQIGGRYGKSPVQVTLRWLVQQANVAAIPKSATRKHLQSNFNIFDFTLSTGEMEAIAALARGERLVDPAGAPWKAS